MRRRSSIRGLRVAPRFPYLHAKIGLDNLKQKTIEVHVTRVHTLQISTLKQNAKFVLPRLKVLIDAQTVRHEHIVGLHDLNSVQKHCSVRVKTVEGQDSLRGTANIRSGEASAVEPVGFADPLDVKFFCPLEGVWDLASL